MTKTKLKIMVSPFFSEEEYKDEVTGFVYRKIDSPYIVTLDDERLGGIKEGLRKNFLIPYDKETLEFVSRNSLPSKTPEAQVQSAPKSEPTPAVEEPEASAPEENTEEEAPTTAKKTTRKRTVKKEKTEE